MKVVDMRMLVLLFIILEGGSNLQTSSSVAVSEISERNLLELIESVKGGGWVAQK